jgi:hypothetical protein
MYFEGGVKPGTEVVGILDMRDRKHKFNFIVGGERNNKPSC